MCTGGVQWSRFISISIDLPGTYQCFTFFPYTVGYLGLLLLPFFFVSSSFFFFTFSPPFLSFLPWLIICPAVFLGGENWFVLYFFFLGFLLGLLCPWPVTTELVSTKKDPARNLGVLGDYQTE